MNFEELTKKVEELKAQGFDDQAILSTFYKAFEDGEMDLEDLKKAAGAIGYSLNEDFVKEYEAANAGGDASEIEDLKEIDENESPEEFKEKIEEANTDSDEVDVNGEKTEDEKEKAMKEFGLR